MPEASFISYNPDGRPYSRRIKDEEWNRLRPVLEKMHKDKTTRVQMLQTLVQDYDFRPSPGQLHARMKQWGYNVYNTNQNAGADDDASEISTVESSEDIVSSTLENSDTGDENNAPPSSSKTSMVDVDEMTPDKGAQLDAFQKSLQATFTTFSPPLDKGVAMAILRYFERRVDLQSKSLAATLERFRDQAARRSGISTGVLLQYWIHRQKRSVYSADTDPPLLPSVEDSQEFPPNTTMLSTISSENRYDFVTMTADIFMAVGCPAAAFATYLVAFSSIEQQPEVSVAGRGWILMNIVRIAMIFKDSELAESYLDRSWGPNNDCKTMLKIIKSHFEALATGQVLDETFCARHALFLNILRSRQLLGNDYFPADSVTHVHELYTTIFRCELEVSFLKRLLLWVLSFLDLGKAFLVDCSAEWHTQTSRSGLFGHLANLFACFLLQQWFLAPEDILLSIMAELGNKHGAGFRCDLTIPETLSAMAHMIFTTASDFAHIYNTPFAFDSITGFLEPTLIELITGSEENRCNAFLEAYLGRFTGQYISNESESGELCTHEALWAAQLFIQRNKLDIAAVVPLSPFHRSHESKSQKLYNTCPTKKEASPTLREIGQVVFSKDQSPILDFQGLFALLSHLRKSCDRPYSEPTISSIIKFPPRRSNVQDGIVPRRTLSSIAEKARSILHKNVNVSASPDSSTGYMTGARHSPASFPGEFQLEKIKMRFQPLPRSHSLRPFSRGVMEHIIDRSKASTNHGGGDSMMSGSSGSGSSASTVSYRSMVAMSSRAHTMHLERRAGLCAASPAQMTVMQESWDFSEVTGMPMDDGSSSKDDSSPPKDLMLL